MNCGNCGAALPLGAKFCPSCSAPVPPAAPPPSYPYPAAPQQTGYPYSAPGRTHTNDGTIALVLGILSIITGPVGIILGPLAIYFGGRVRQQDDWGNIGWILGIIGTIIGVLVLLIFILPLIFFFGVFRPF